MYQFFIPPTTALLQWLIYGRALVWLQWIGLAVLIAGVIFSAQARQRSLNGV
jgi:drug/metabolite transporter (DMT)-like permease